MIFIIPNYASLCYFYLLNFHEMRSSLFIYTLAIIYSIILLSCSKDSSNNDEGSNEICYKFIDKETNFPIQGLGILMHIERNNGASADLTLQGSTDENGNICKYTSSSLGNITDFLIQNPTNQLYWTPLCPIPHGESVEYPGTSFYLSPTAYIRFHIQSFYPQNDIDYLYIRYNFLEFQAVHTIICLDGMQLNEIQSDTIIIKHTRAGSNKIWWTKYMNDNIINSDEQNISIATGDTLDVEIIHQ